jgi:predicted MFS family arabinose efflux permease
MAATLICGLWFGNSHPYHRVNPLRHRVLVALVLLYVTQGIPFGIAAEYLPVVLRKAGYSLATIAALGWLQLPWQLKVLWAGAADQQTIRARSRSILLALQLLLALSIAAYAIVPLARAPIVWFVVTFVAAFFASSQDVFVDALAVRALSRQERGLGNVAQVAGYRAGILTGGAGLLIVVGSLGSRPTLLIGAAIVASASVAAFFVRDEHEPDPEREAKHERLETRALVRHLFGRETWPIVAIACSYKLGLHVAAVLIKPMVVDAHWTERQIGLAVVIVGTGCSLVGAAMGGLLHKRFSEARALAIAAVVQVASCLPLVAASATGVPRALAVLAIASEHLASGVGTTVLFAALMSATRPANAGLHYTILTSLNALAIGVGGVVGGRVGDRAGMTAAFVLATVLSLIPLLLLPRWKRAVLASSG